ncbi:MAG: DUF6530 family protein [Armatimonadota bacterium]
MGSREIPKQLKHKPILVLENYDAIDGLRAGKETDAKGLSIGWAQWNGPGDNEMSAKVWRHSGEKWSRQSEELPFHRVFDLAIMITDAMLWNQTIGPTHHQIQGEDVEVSIDKENARLQGLLQKHLQENGEVLSIRLKILSEQLRKLGY